MENQWEINGNQWKSMDMIYIVMFLFDERNPCTFRGISVYLAFATPCMGARDLSASVMIVVVADNIVDVLSHVLGYI